MLVFNGVGCTCSEVDSFPPIKMIIIPGSSKSVRCFVLVIITTHLCAGKYPRWWQLKYFSCSPLFGEDFQFD